MSDHAFDSEAESLLRRDRRAALPEGLREQVLTGVRRELAESRRRRENLAGAAAAACLALAVTANVWIVRSIDRQREEFFGPSAYERRVREWAEFVAKSTGEETAEPFETWLLAQPRPAAPPWPDLEALGPLVRELNGETPAPGRPG